MKLDWENNKIHIRAPHLQHLLDEIKRQINLLGYISFHHVYREMNEEANSLSKSVLLLATGTILEEERNSL